MLFISSSSFSSNNYDYLSDYLINFYNPMVPKDQAKFNYYIYKNFI